LAEGRKAILVDNNQQALEVMCKRFDANQTTFHNWNCKKPTD